MQSSLIKCLGYILTLISALLISTSKASETEHEKIYYQLLADFKNKDLFRVFLSTLPQYNGYYIFQGDMLKTDEEVWAEMSNIYLENQEGAEPVPDNGELRKYIVGGVPQYYKSLDSRKLTYAIDKESFASAPTGAYSKVKSELETAMNNWESTCIECKIDFIDTGSTSPVQGEQWFIVKYQDSASFIAAAFFPNYSEDRRYLFVSPSYFTTNYRTVGVMEHELGHVLGYPHEHTGKELSGCKPDGAKWEPITDYDPRSVMHYFCGGGGSLDLKISETDRQGHRKLYLLN